MSIIKDMITNRQLEPDDQVWCKGMKEWRRIRDSHLSDLVEAEPPPVSGEHINNTLAWVLAVLPLAFGIDDAWVAAQGGVRTALPRQIPIAIDTLIALWDEHWLKKSWVQ